MRPRRLLHAFALTCPDHLHHQFLRLAAGLEFSRCCASVLWQAARQVISTAMFSLALHEARLITITATHSGCIQCRPHSSAQVSQLQACANTALVQEEQSALALSPTMILAWPAPRSFGQVSKLKCPGIGDSGRCTGTRTLSVSCRWEGRRCTATEFVGHRRNIQSMSICR